MHVDEEMSRIRAFFLEVSLSLFFVIACFIGRNLDSDDFLYLHLGFQSYACDERVRLVMALPSTPKRRATAARVTFNGAFRLRILGNEFVRQIIKGLALTR